MIHKTLRMGDDQLSVIERVDGSVSIVKEVRNYEGAFEPSQQVTVGRPLFETLKDWLVGVKRD